MAFSGMMCEEIRAQKSSNLVILYIDIVRALRYNIQAPRKRVYTVAFVEKVFEKNSKKVLTRARGYGIMSKSPQKRGRTVIEN